MSAPRKVLLVGWDSADWKAINPLLDAGKMPHLEQLINGGVIGNLATLYPVLSPMLWTSIGTGKRPMKHGIHGFAEPDPHTGGVRPITNLSRKTKAVWNILAQNGKKCIVVGWWPSHPAEPLPEGVMISNHYQRAPNTDPTKPWPMQKGTVYPERLEQTLADLRIHPAELDGSHVLPFVPKAGEVDQKKDRRLEGLAKTIADCTCIQSAATHLIQTEPWDFMAVYFDAIDHFGHGFMRYHPPRQKWVSEKDFELYSGVIEAGYRYHDMMLGVLMAMAGPDTTVLLMSDHGFHPDHLRPSVIPVEPAGPAVEHRHYGIFALKGAGIKKDERIYGTTVLDICPTLLTLFGLPVGRDMDGKPLVTVYSDPPEVKTVPSWDDVTGTDGSHPPGTKLDAGEAREALKQLEALGYIQPLPENAEKAVADTQQELDYNLACAHTDANQYAAASKIFLKLWTAQPTEHRYGSKYISSLLALRKFPEARAAIERLRENRKKYGIEARAELKKLRKKLKGKKPADLKPNEQFEMRKLAARASMSPVPMLQMDSMLLMSENKPDEALKVLKKLEKAGRTQPDFLAQLGRCSLSAKHPREAERYFKKALELDPENAQAHFGLAQVRLAQRRNFEAAGEALTSVGLLYHNPIAHFYLGVALHRLGKIPRAVDAYNVCLSQSPSFLPAHRRLAMIYQNRLKDPKKAAEHREKIKSFIEQRRKQLKEPEVTVETAPATAAVAVTEKIKPSETPAASTFDPAALEPARKDVPFATIVSGLPRSGTSLMMQMLAAGGIPPLHDNHRPADTDNPRGYFEFAPAKNLRAGAEWMPHAKGRVLKLVAQLLPFLPPSGAKLKAASAKKGKTNGVIPPYKIIFMERSLDEVLASQDVMLERHGRKGAALTPERLRGIYEQQLAQVDEVLAQRRLPILRIKHADCLRQPAAVAAQVKNFLDLPLDHAAMAATVDKSLYRQRK
jgi:predicted AlkP superfamily phosphohydrolase/phosphomutase/tetratricopeptide (TPR) repeat protein